MQKTAFICSNELIKQCNKLPTMSNRASMVIDLINAYNLLQNPNLDVVIPHQATEEDLKLFHSSDFVDFIKNIDENSEENVNEYGLGYDCPILEGHYDFVRVVAGSSVTAAKLLNAEKYKVVINWFGGWHHAQRDSAEGFCYVNDIVIAIQILAKKFAKVLYIDLDVHHGNGVQNAFEYSKNILTLSFHRSEVGFYPGSGLIDDIGSGKGKFHSINVPFKCGISDENYLKLFNSILPKVFSAFEPMVLVVQCGADVILGDPIGETNVTLDTIGKCVSSLLRKKLPTLFLGGGGYNFANTARLWTYLTSIILDEKIINEIPDSSNYFTKYVPCYELHIKKGNQKDQNTDTQINDTINQIELYCNEIKTCNLGNTKNVLNGVGSIS